VVLVDRRSDHHHHIFCTRDGLSFGGGTDSVGIERPREDLARAWLREREHTSVHSLTCRGVSVDELDLESPIRECETEGKADVAAATNDRDIYS